MEWMAKDIETNSKRMLDLRTGTIAIAAYLADDLRTKDNDVVYCP